MRTAISPSLVKIGLKTKQNKKLSVCKILAGHVLKLQRTMIVDILSRQLRRTSSSSNYTKISNSLKSEVIPSIKGTVTDPNKKVFVLY